jgi:hypothetical protein
MANDAVKGVGMNEVLFFVFGIAVGIAIGLIIAFSVSPTMQDVVKLDNQSCILIYEGDLVHKFCEAK